MPYTLVEIEWKADGLPEKTCRKAYGTSACRLKSSRAGIGNDQPGAASQYCRGEFLSPSQARRAAIMSLNKDFAQRNRASFRAAL